MEKKLLTIMIGFFIVMIILFIGPVLNYMFIDEKSSIYGAITLNTLINILLGYLIIKKLSEINTSIKDKKDNH
ncbi:hypothetical protein WKT02_05875 [Erysipelotrichaceae bacterium HCN-30851]